MNQDILQLQVIFLLPLRFGTKLTVNLISDEKNQRLNSNSAGPSPQGSRPPSINNENQIISQQNTPTTQSDTMRFPPASPGHNYSPAPAAQNQHQQKLGNFMDTSPTGKCPTSEVNVNKFRKVYSIGQLLAFRGFLDLR